MHEKKCYVYFLTNPNNDVIYVGVTNNLSRRAQEHKEKLIEGFTKKYNCTKLIYYEVYDYIKDALEREKQIKGGSRKKKVDLINKENPYWTDLSDDL